MTIPARVPVQEDGGVSCPLCAGRFQVEVSSIPEKPRPGGPNCPKCGAVVTLDQMLVEESGLGMVGQERMWYCPRCLAILGFTAWKR